MSVETAPRPIRAAILGVAVLTCALATGCGDEDSQTEQAAKSKPVAATPVPDKDPYAITCKDLADPLASAEMSRRATVKLASTAKVPDLSPLRASQSIFYAMTELCKQNGDAYKPAKDAVAAVEEGKYRADLGDP